MGFFAVYTNLFSQIRPTYSKEIKVLPTIIPPNKETAWHHSVNEETGIEDLLFHDIRHETITRLVNKLDVMGLARMTGHRDLKLLMIYYNAPPAKIAAALG